MDPKFPSFMLAELKELVADLENGLQPSNGVLHETVVSELRRQYDKQRYRLDGTQAWQG
jgi:hypothetical protein